MSSSLFPEQHIKLLKSLIVHRIRMLKGLSDDRHGMQQRKMFRITSPSVRKPATSMTGVKSPLGSNSGLLTPSGRADTPGIERGKLC